MKHFLPKNQYTRKGPENFPPEKVSKGENMIVKLIHSWLRSESKNSEREKNAFLTHTDVSNVYYAVWFYCAK